MAIQALHPGTKGHSPHRLKWVAAHIIPAVYKALSNHLVLKRQTLNTLLQPQTLFKVDVLKHPMAGASRGGAFTCPS